MIVYRTSTFTGNAERSLPMPRGFKHSRYNPLVYRIAIECLASEPDGADTAIVLAGITLDCDTTDMASKLLNEGQVHNPILFGQSVPTSILGKIAAERGVTGPIITLSARLPNSAASALTASILETRRAKRVLAINVELCPAARPTAALESAGISTVDREEDRGAAVLVGMDERRAGDHVDTNGLSALLELAKETRA